MHAAPQLRTRTNTHGGVVRIRWVVRHGQPRHTDCRAPPSALRAGARPAGRSAVRERPQAPSHPANAPTPAQDMLAGVCAARGVDYEGWIEGLKQAGQWHVEVY